MSRAATEYRRCNTLTPLSSELERAERWARAHSSARAVWDAKDYAERFSIFSAVIPVGDLAWACLRWNDKQTEQKT